MIAAIAIAIVFCVGIAVALLLLVRRSTGAGGGDGNEAMVRNWHAAISNECRSILGRSLTKAEMAFITSRGGFIALEAIEEQVRSLRGRPAELEHYLRSDEKSPEAD